MAKITPETFGTAPISLLNDKNISISAKGLYAFMNSKPKDWEFSMKGLRSQLKEGRDKIQSLLKELENNGYLKREKYQTKEGKWAWEYIILLGEKYTTRANIQGTINGKTINGFSGYGEKLDKNSIKPTIEANIQGNNTSKTINGFSVDGKPVHIVRKNEVRKSVSKKENTPTQNLFGKEYLYNLISGIDTEELQEEFGITKQSVISVAENIRDYQEETGKQSKNYKATVRKWIRGDLESKKITQYTQKGKSLAREAILSETYEEFIARQSYDPTADPDYKPEPFRE